MIGLELAILFGVILNLVVMVWASARAQVAIVEAVSRQDDRIRKQRERRASDDDEDDIEDIVDRVRTAAANITDEQVTELLRRNPGARRVGDY